MAKAQITTPEGLRVHLEGTPEEIAAVFKEAGVRAKAAGAKTLAHKPARKKVTIPSLIDELKHEGFFKSPRTLPDIRKKLAELGRNYPVTTLSGAMQGQAKKRNLRRFKEKKKYVYAQ
jgi:superfamily II DNA/RNA helicase